MVVLSFLVYGTLETYRKASAVEWCVGGRERERPVRLHSTEMILVSLMIEVAAQWSAAAAAAAAAATYASFDEGSKGSN